MNSEVPTDNRLFVVSAPSGSGKTSLIKRALAELRDLKLSVSHTTRPPRAQEIEGQDYHFVDKSTFIRMRAQGDFLEHATVFGEYYGTSKKFVENELNRGCDIVMEIDWQGARQLRAYYADTFSIFILPPSLHSLKERLERRAQDSKAVIALRMQQAITEARHYTEYEYIIVNDDFARASAEFIGILSRRLSAAEMRESRQRLNKATRTLGLNSNCPNDD